MTTAPRYEAAWAPGLREDIDRDESITAAFRWLRDAERRHGGRGIIVMNAVSMRQHRGEVLRSAPWDIVSKRSGRPGWRGPVLAIWPSAETLDFAEDLAIGSALCVIGGTTFNVSGWIRRTGAECLVDGYPVEPPSSLPPDVSESLKSMLSFGSHNGFLGAGEKEVAIPILRRIAAQAGAPSREEIESYLRASGETDADGATRAGQWYDEIRQGRRHRDHSGRTIV
jgi:hypothetical protein